MSFGRVVSRILPVTLLTLLLVHCSGSPSDSVVLTAEMPLHLEDHLEAVVLEGSDVPEDLPQPVAWDFAEPQPEWKVQEPWNLERAPSGLLRTEDALRIALNDADVTDDENDSVWGAIYIDLPDWERDDWAHVQVRVRSEADVDFMGLILAFNFWSKSEMEEGEYEHPVKFFGERAPIIRDGTVQTYTLRADWSGGQWEGSWQQLILGFWAEKEASVDVLSVTVIPKEATYAGEPAGVHSEVRNRVYSRALYTHTPGRVEYRVRVPEAGRLDLGLGVLREDAPVTFRITAGPAGAEPEPVFEETYDDKESWGQRSVDLSHLAGQTVDLALEAESPRPGTVALWAAPRARRMVSPRTSAAPAPPPP